MKTEHIVTLTRADILQLVAIKLALDIPVDAGVEVYYDGGFTPIEDVIRVRWEEAHDNRR